MASTPNYRQVRLGDNLAFITQNISKGSQQVHLQVH